MSIIDVWAQIPTPRMAEAEWMDSLLRWTGQDRGAWVPDTAAMLAAMDEAGVDMALLSAWHDRSGFLISNDEVDAQIDAAPERFRGLATVDLRNPVAAAREVRRRADGGRFVGVRILPWLWDLPPNDRRYYPVYAACVEANVPFCTQIGHTGPLCRSEPGRLIPYLDDVLLDFPDLKVVGGHVGYPWIDEVISLAFKYPNFFVDTSAYALHRLPRDFTAFMKGPGSTRVMFGTNWPMISFEKCLRHLDGLGLSAEQERAFLVENAKRVFGL